MSEAALHGSMHGTLGIGVPALTLLVYAVLAGALALYAAAAARARRAPRSWSALRAASFAAGIVLIAVAAAPPIAAWAHGDLRGHMAQHLLLGMFAPLALVLGAPGTLVLRSLPTPAARRAAAALGTRPVRVLSHPITALLLDIGGMYVLYLTPLYAASRADPIAHALVHVHFLVSGYLFTWSIAGPDPAPRRPGPGMRLLVLLAATAAHGILAKLMYAYGWPRGAFHSPDEIEAAAQWMYYGGDAAELLLAAAFFARFGRGMLNRIDTPSCRRPGRRTRRARPARG